VTLDAWLGQVGAELGTVAVGGDDGGLRDLLLELTRDVAHQVARPAAPLTSFLVGLAAGAAGGSVEAVRDAVARVRAMLPEPGEPGP